MNDFNSTITKDNIFQLLRHSGLTDEQFANIIEISVRWLGYIKNDRYEFKIKEIEKASKFFNVPFNTLTSKRLTISKKLRDNLIITHKSNTEYLKPLLDHPSIPYAIEFTLLDDPDFQGRELEVKDIKAIFKKNNWDFASSSISNGLKFMSHLIRVRSHPTKKGTNLYSKRK